MQHTYTHPLREMGSHCVQSRVGYFHLNYRFLWVKFSLPFSFGPWTVCSRSIHYSLSTLFLNATWPHCRLGCLLWRFQSPVFEVTAGRGLSMWKFQNVIPNTDLSSNTWIIECSWVTQQKTFNAPLLFDLFFKSIFNLIFNSILNNLISP